MPATRIPVLTLVGLALRTTLFLIVVYGYGTGQATAGQDGTARPIPHRDVKIAHGYFQDARFANEYETVRRKYDLPKLRSAAWNEEIGRLNLMDFVTHEAAGSGDLGYARANLAWARANSWNARFLEEFDRQIGWMADLLAGHPDRIWEFVRQWQRDWSHEKDKVIVQLRESEVFSLKLLAHRRGSLKATFEWAQEQLGSHNPADTRSLELGLGLLADAAHKGYAPALFDIIRRYRYGHGVTIDLLRAYYWTLRADAVGVDVSEPLATLSALLTPKQRGWAEEWIAEDRVKGDLGSAGGERHQ